MIVSHRYKYLFVEVPRTGSTAISSELREHYDGHEILKKHSYYSTFLQQATEEEKKYRVFSGVRNPLDDAVSSYRKYSTKDRAYYEGNRRNLRRHAYVQGRSLTFSEYLHKFYRLPYDRWTSTYHHQFDKVIRFENIQADFAAIVEMIGAKLVRPLPQKNKTDRDRDFVKYYTPDDIRKAVWVFGPYMKLWSYELPEAWGDQRVPMSSLCLYKLMSSGRKFYWNNLRQGEGVIAKGIQKLLYG